MSDIIVVDTNKLNGYAQRLTKVTSRVSRLDSRIDSLYFKVKLTDLRTLRQADTLTRYNRNLGLCRSYLLATADDFEKVEQTIRKTDPEQLSRIRAGETQTLLNLLRKFASRVSGNDDSPKSIFDFLDDFYNGLSAEDRLAIKVLMPDIVQQIYTVVSGLHQGDLTVEEVWDIAKDLASDKVAVVLQAIDYSFNKGQLRSDEMERQMIEQLREGDVLGAVIDLGEGFIDTIIGGAIDVTGDVLGGAVDGLIDEIPVVKGINMATEYVTGLFGANEGDGYSIGGLIGTGAEAISDGLDYVTDGVTYVTDIVTDGITSGFKGGIKFVKSWFD